MRGYSSLTKATATSRPAPIGRPRPASATALSSPIRWAEVPPASRPSCRQILQRPGRPTGTSPPVYRRQIAPTQGPRRRSASSGWAPRPFVASRRLSWIPGPGRPATHRRRTRRPTTMTAPCAPRRRRTTGTVGTVRLSSGRLWPPCLRDLPSSECAPQPRNRTKLGECGAQSPCRRTSTRPWCANSLSTRPPGHGTRQHTGQ